MMKSKIYYLLTKNKKVVCFVLFLSCTIHDNQTLPVQYLRLLAKRSMQSFFLRIFFLSSLIFPEQIVFVMIVCILGFQFWFLFLTFCSLIFSLLKGQRLRFVAISQLMIILCGTKISLKVSKRHSLLKYLFSSAPKSVGRKSSKPIRKCTKI